MSLRHYYDLGDGMLEDRREGEDEEMLDVDEGEEGVLALLGSG